MVTIGACSAQRYRCDRGDLGIALQTEITYIKIDDFNGYMNVHATLVEDITR